MHASSLYLAHVVFVRTPCAADDAAACAVSKCLGPLLDPGSLGSHKLFWRCCRLCSLRTPRAFTRPGFSWQAQSVTAMLQLMQSPNASGLYSTRVLLASTKYSGDAAACAVSERPGLLLDPGSPGRYEVRWRCFSLGSNNSTHDDPSSTVLRLVATPSSFADVAPKVAGACAALKRTCLTYKCMKLYRSMW